MIKIFIIEINKWNLWLNEIKSDLNQKKNWIRICRAFALSLFFPGLLSHLQQNGMANISGGFQQKIDRFF